MIREGSPGVGYHKSIITVRRICWKCSFSAWNERVKKQWMMRVVMMSDDKKDGLTSERGGKGW